MSVNGTAVDAEEGKGYCAILSLCLLWESERPHGSRWYSSMRRKNNSCRYKFLEVNATIIKYTGEWQSCSIFKVLEALPSLTDSAFPRLELTSV